MILFFETGQKICLFIDIGEKNWPVYKENWPKTDTTEKHNTPAPRPRSIRVDVQIARATKDTTPTPQRNTAEASIRSHRSDFHTGPGPHTVKPMTKEAQRQPDEHIKHQHER